MFSGLYKKYINQNNIYDSSQRLPLFIDELVEVIRYRNLVGQLIRRDIVARYKRSILGIAWTMLNPLGMMIVLSIVFSQLFHTVEGYAAYVLSGIVAWNFFSQSTSAVINTLAWGGDFLRRIYVPRSVFAISGIGTGMVNLLLALVPLTIVMLVVGLKINWTILLVPIPMLLLAGFALGVGLLISSLAMYFPDIVEMYSIILMAWMYLTPILYPFDILPDTMKQLMSLNPMYWFIGLFRRIIYEGQTPILDHLIIMAILSLGTLLIGWFVFTRKSDEFAYRT